VAVLTNGSLLGLKEVRHDLAGADLVLPSLDAVSVEVFNRINRPHPSLQIGEIISGLLDFRRDYPGEIWLEILLVSGINDLTPEVNALRKVVQRLQPVRVQLNTVDRPPAAPWARPVSGETLDKLACLLGRPTEVISRSASPASSEPATDDLAQRIVEMVSRRPCTVQQISNGLSAEFAQVSELLNSMTQKGQIDCSRHQNNYYYTSRIT
jgi:wyosine [tRNA(Phe)-imidazoG37] synthetase (radical SAM superfamily)